MKKESNLSVIDFHCHILPSADHGSDGIDTSLAQLKLMEKAGIDIAVSSTHFYPQKETVEEFLKKRDRAAEELSKAKNSSIRVALGAEVYAVAGMEALEGLEKLTVKGTNTLLLEMPSGFWNTNIIDTVFSLDEKFNLVLAHIDRYPSGELSKLLDMGLSAQVNAHNSLRGFNKHRLAEWISEGNVVAIGSDLHGTDAKVTKAFSKMQKYLKGDIKEIFAESARLIEGAELI